MLLDEGVGRGWRFWLREPQPLDLTGILWPSLGYPSVIEASTGTVEASALLCLPGNQIPAPDRIKARLRSALDPAERPVSLKVVTTNRVTLVDVRGIGRWAPWVVGLSPFVVRVVFSFAAPEVQRRMNLFDLEIECDGKNFTKPGAIAVRRPNVEFRVALATDIHVATRWDEIEEGFSKFFVEADASEDPTLVCSQEVLSRQVVLNTFINPNRNLCWFIRTVNEMASRDELDAVIMSGDLVDFKYSRDRDRSGTSYEDTEWKLFRDIILGATKDCPRLEVPLFTSTGNHDYRLYPYRVRTYGLYHAGVPDEISELYFRAINEWGLLKYAPSDLDSLCVDTGLSHSLNYYFREFNPCLDYELSLGGAEFLVLDTGPDAMTDSSHLATKRRKRFLRSSFNISVPCSNGYDEMQIEYARQWFEQAAGKTAVIVTHAPLIVPLEACLSSQAENLEGILDVPRPDDRDIYEFEQELTDRGLIVGAVFRNQLPIFQALREHKGSTVFFAGHCHTQAEMALDKATGCLRLGDCSTTTNISGAIEDSALLFHTPALAHYKTEEARTGNPSYRMIRLKESGVQDVTLIPVLERPLDEWVYDWTCTKEGESVERVDFTFLSRTVEELFTEVQRRLILRFNGTGLQGMKVTVPDPAAVIASRIELDNPNNAYACWIIGDEASFQVKLKDRPQGARISFLYETMRDGCGPGLRWHFRSHK